jgi:hypothetical protein
MAKTFWTVMGLVVGCSVGCAAPPPYGTCLSETDNTCPGGTVCIALTTMADTRYICSRACSTGSDCPSGPAGAINCSPNGPVNVCRVPCSSSTDCPAGQTCTFSECWP